jgi:glycerol kinase
MRFVLSLDEGTTSARAAIYDDQGRRTAMQSQPFASRYPQPGWVEQDPEEIWQAQLEAIRGVLASAGVPAQSIAAIGITNQRETTIVWERKTGRPVFPAIVWQCRRTADFCTQLAASSIAPTITRKTGLVIDAYFSASKIRWILENVPDAKQKAHDGELLFGTVDTWLIWKLTNGAVHVSDPSNASRTMLMDIRIVASSAVAGVAVAEHLDAEIPIAGIAGDQQAALFGQACFRSGLSKNTYGTGCFALMQTGSRQPTSQHKLLTTRAASPGHHAQYAVEGSIFIGGAAVQWVRDKLGLISTAAESAAIAESVESTGGVYFVPAFVGLGSPHWDSQARGMITGITQGTGRAEIVRASLEGIAYQVRELVEAMEADSGESLKELRVDGGASANNFLLQFQADILGKRIVRPADVETTALGAAYLAGLATGFFRSLDEIENFWQADQVFEPRMSSVTRDVLWSGWKTAIARCRYQ